MERAEIAKPFSYNFHSSCSFVAGSGRSANRSSHLRCSITKGVLRNFAKFTGKHLCQTTETEHQNTFGCLLLSKALLSKTKKASKGQK